MIANGTVSDVRAKGFQRTIPVLVDHHDGQEHADGEEENPVDVMRNGITDLDTESKQENAANDVEGDTEDDVADNPSVVQCSDDENELRDRVDDDADGWEDEVGDEEADGIGIGE